MADASNHFARKTLFTKVDYSQAHQCVQMADGISTQLFTFNSSSQIYANKCLAPGLSKSVTGFKSFIPHYLDLRLAAESCTPFMDDIESAVENCDGLISTLREIFTYIRKCGQKLSSEKRVIEKQKVKFLVKVVTPLRISPERAKFDEFLKKTQLLKTKKNKLNE